VCISVAVGFFAQFLAKHWRRACVDLTGGYCWRTPINDISISWVRFLEACFGFCSGVIVAGMSDYRHKRHNVSSLIYHIVCPAKYRRVIFDAEVDTVLKDVCLDIAKRYEIAFLEIGTDKDHVHFLVQSVPSYSPTKIVKTIKSLTAREIFHRVPTVKKRLWGGEFWSKGYFISTVGRHGNEEAIRQYVKQQGSDKEPVAILF
jgi:putative transposase